MLAAFLVLLAGANLFLIIIILFLFIMGITKVRLFRSFEKGGYYKTLIIKLTINILVFFSFVFINSEKAMGHFV